MRILKLLPVILLVFLLLPGKGDAAEPAAEISGSDLVTETKNIHALYTLFDKNYRREQAGVPNMEFTLSHEEGIGSLYFMFRKAYGPFTVISDQGKEYTCGTEGFLHEFVDLKEAFEEVPESVTVRFGEVPPRLTELRVFGPGEPPEDVQRWKKAPEEGVDLLLFSAHGDDEQLFFAGVLPYYAVGRGYEVQVVYSTDHENYNPSRVHEMLNGLWAVGVKNYPVFGPFPDLYVAKAVEARTGFVNWGFEEDDMEKFVVEQLRRFRPLVAVGHDIHGEYGHGVHKLYGLSLQSGAERSKDPAAYPESAEKWGVWDVPKTYLHLYSENQIHMNWDRPLEQFDGMTPYEVCKEKGYPAHESQYGDFAWYFYGMDTAEEIEELSPCEYGLCRSTVGEDIRKDDFFENLLSRGEQRIQEQEKLLKEEAERQRIREEEERKQREEEMEARRAAEQAAAEAEQERLRQEELQKENEKMKGYSIALGSSIAAGLLGAWIVLKVRKEIK